MDEEVGGVDKEEVGGVEVEESVDYEELGGVNVEVVEIVGEEEVQDKEEVEGEEEVEGADMKTVDEGAEGRVNSQGEGHKGCLYLKMPQVFR